jgi:hypothetical protein
MMVLGKLKEIIMNDNVFTIAFCTTIIALIAAVTFYHYNELQAVKSNVESAIVKGIDPVAVRCAYASGQDMICVTYAATHQKP